MKKRTTFIAGLLAISIGGSAAIALSPSGDPDVVELLSGINFFPNRSNIDDVLGSAAVEDLILIAEDDSEDSDVGLRIRAYRALGVYEDSENKNLAISSLQLSLQNYSDGEAEELLFLRASLLSLAQLAKADAVVDLLPFLDHPSRDIRASSAQALGITESSAAIEALSELLNSDESQQVRVATEDALAVIRAAHQPTAN